MDGVLSAQVFAVIGRIVDENVRSGAFRRIKVRLVRLGASGCVLVRSGAFRCVRVRLGASRCIKVH